MDAKKLLRIGGICAIAEALIYITAFIIYGGVLEYPAANSTAVEEINFLTDQYVLLSVMNLVSYVLFGILLAVLVLAIHEHLKKHSPALSKLAAVFGFIWVGLVIASGMIASIGLNTVTKVGALEPEKAMLLWSNVGIVSEGLGGGNEIVGGIWVLLLSIVALTGKLFSKPLGILGIFVGTAGIFTIYPLDLFKEIFGISQIVWFLWIGIVLIRKS